MLNYIAIGTGVTLDLQTRTLARTDQEANVTLPQSACLCLAAMAEAQGEVLSQEQLMDIGWRSAGVEVTENSVRVMITKLRRAFAQLEVHETVTLVAVTRSGYRLVVRENGAEQPAPDAKSPVLLAETDTTTSPTVAPTLPRARQSITLAVGVTLAGLFAGVGLAILLRNLFFFSPIPVHFVPWNGPGIPPGAEVLVQQSDQNKQALIEATLQTYKQHVLDRRADEQSAPVLYVTTGSEKMSKFQGLIACQQRLKDSGNDCESFYFRLY
ncbi:MULTISPECIES: winged helix-turn-helix domain-containing protein [Enterobacter]|jgi:DNA-binding winged helix-turn-helix (wHTH) protein|uniref:winged helix-turn-helix domain-containing protein n=1 Tax=Enterobacter TaxID=547 RepID=UPI0010665542|nr:MULTISPECIES: winged helix-turn-helix domain-containing protein [Enterobacter]MDZ5702204.1 winged helix-turn-helix domain-containing protein [Enterobacter ludwigii]QLO89686.1 winged helix-turn-helix domain-containing protein [Enterobacter sp. RHBSTW-00975]HDR2461406.1 winged helix-turn-helix domain-containing protein [Enterobacter ludwigii]